MSEFSDYTETNVLNASLKGITYPLPTGVYVALFTTDPLDAGSGSEVLTANWTGYTRQDAAGGAAIATGWGSITNGVISNAKVITFPANGGAGDVIVTHIGLMDTGGTSGGNLLYHTPLTTAKTVQPSDVLSFAIGAITVTVD